jgi:hypothetical protein
VGGLVWRERCEIKGNVSSFLPIKNYRFTYRVGEADLVIDAWVFSCEVSQEVLRPTYFIDYPVSKSARMLDFVDADFIDIEFTKNFFNHIMKAGAMNL